VDGLVSKITYDFLQNLSNRGYDASFIRIGYRIKDSVRSNILSSKTHPTLSSTLNQFSFTQTDTKYLCYSGPFPVISNLKINVNYSKFSLSFSYFDILGSRMIKQTSKFDSLRNSAYSIESQKVENVINGLMDKYKKDIETAIKIRVESYLDPCYVDSGYVSPNSN